MSCSQLLFPCLYIQVTFLAILSFTMPKAKTKDIFFFYLSYWSRYKWLGLASFLMAALGYGLGTLAPLYLKQLVDTLVAGGVTRAASAEAARPIFIALVALWLINWLVWRINGILENRFQTKVMSAILSDAFAKLFAKGYRFFSDHFTGALVRRIGRLSDGFEQLQDILLYSFLHLIITVGGVILVLFTQAPLLGIIFSAWALLLIGIQILFGIWKQTYNREAAAQDSAIAGALADAVGSHETIRSFASEIFEHGLFCKAITSWRNAALRSWDLDALNNAVSGLLSVGAQVAVFYALISRWGAGTISIGDIVLVQTYFFFAIDQLFSFSNVIRRYYRAMANAEEGVAILAEAPEIRDVQDPQELLVQKGGVVFDTVSFSFNDAEPVFKNLSLTIHGGEKVALVGHSGAGKSTIVKLLLRLYDVAGGRIMIDGTDIAAARQNDLRRVIALVPQDPVLFHRSLMENIRYGRLDASDEEVIEAAKRAHCHEFISRFANGYDTLVGERGVKLSGGERQRIAIARAMLKNAPILILDEATSSLDSESERYIQDALNVLMEGKTVLVIAHRLSTIMHMDRIIVLEGGEVVDQGTHAELIAREGVYQKLWSIQAGGFIGE